MKLEVSSIENFRSIEKTSITDCGGFNVIIGKNNAGKSSLLIAINAFFSCLEKGEPIILSPPIGRTLIDYHNNRNADPIAITMLFKLSQAEHDNLVQSIVSAAPQLRNAVDVISSDLKLAVTLCITSGQTPFAYVSKILMCKPDTQQVTSDKVVCTILEINIEAALQLMGKAKRGQELKNEIVAIQEFIAERFRYLDDEDWTRLKNESPFSEGAIGLYSRSGIRLSNQTNKKFQEIARTVNSKNEFQEAATVLISSMREEIEQLQLEQIDERITSFSGQETSVPSYALSLMKEIGKLKVLYLTERREQIGKREAARLLELKVRRGGPEKLQFIQETVSSLLGVKIDAFSSDGPRSRDEPDAELDVDQFLVQVNGAGIREALRLILDYEFGHPDILLVEEPETHLHPALETSMMRYLKTIGKESQIFVTTHSTNFLDTTELNNVYLATKETSTTIQLLGVEEVQESILHELGIRLSSFFMFDRLVFVEGPTDEEVIREWAFKLNINLAQSGVGFISMGGVRNLGYFSSEAIITFLSRRKVSLLFIIDKDEKDKDEIKKITDQLGNKAKLLVLDKRELENYLLSPSALVNFIKFKKEMLGEKNFDISEDNVKSVLEDCAEELKIEATNRRIAKIVCSPIYPDKGKVIDTTSGLSVKDKVSKEYTELKKRLQDIEDNLSSTIETETNYVNSHWATDKLNIVPGDMLISNLCQKFGVKFNKVKDSAKLASLMQPDEIDSKIKITLKSMVDLF